MGVEEASTYREEDRRLHIFRRLVLLPSTPLIDSRLAETAGPPGSILLHCSVPHTSLNQHQQQDGQEEGFHDPREEKEAPYLAS